MNAWARRGAGCGGLIGAWVGVLVSGLFWGLPVAAAPVSSAFTYQGELFDEGRPAVGSYDIRFTPYGDAVNPGLLGPPLVVEDVLVSAGVFTARIDFGAGFFVGDAVFLEIALRPFDSVDPNAFETLTPRQEITAAPYTLKPAPGSVTDIELAGDAVGSAQLADASVAPQDLDVGSGAFDTTFWRVGGNSGASGGLGTTGSTRLDLFSPVGVTINGAAANNNTELTIRGNAANAETNVDLSLWPRGGEAFFNLGVIGATPLDARFVVHSIGTNPFTGFGTRAVMGFDGALRLGNGDVMPQARLHLVRNSLGFDAPADASEQMELVIEDVDAQLGLYSAADGSAGSVIGLAEMDAGNFVNQWGLFRRTTAGNAALQLSFGNDSSAAGNPVLFGFGTNASLSIGNLAPNGETELYVAGSPSGSGTGADLSLQPRGGNHLFNLNVDGTNETNTAFSLQFSGATANYAQRMGVTGTGSFGAGKHYSLAHGGAFVFADDSSATPFATTGANQFLVRASGGAALNGAPFDASTELTVNSDSSSAGAAASIMLRPGSSTRGYSLEAFGSTAANTTFQLNYRDPGGAEALSPYFVIRPNGFASINPATSGGSYILPTFPLTVGVSGDTTNGNGAHINPNGTYSSSSSRHFKQAFTAIDPGAILEKLLALPITRWRYKGEADWHLGPVAEEFHAAFGLGDEDRYIVTVDADGVALAAIQGLAARNEARADALQRENETLREALAVLAQRVSSLERGD